MLNRRAFEQGSPATLRLHLRAQLLLELFVLADAQASPLPVVYLSPADNYHRLTWPTFTGAKRPR